MKILLCNLRIFAVVILVCTGCLPVGSNEVKMTTVSSRATKPTPHSSTLTPSIGRTLSVTALQSMIPSMTPTASRITSKDFKALLKNSGCNLPCWLGMEPGSTNIDQAKHEMAIQGMTLIGSQVENAKTVVYNYGFDLYNPDLVTNDIEITFFEEVLRKIVVKTVSTHEESFWEIWSTYLPKMMLIDYVPDQILVLINSNRPSKQTGNVTYRLLFIYSENHTFVEYRGLTKEEDGEYKLCPSTMDEGNLTPAITISIGEHDIEYESYMALDTVSGESLQNITTGIQTKDYCILAKSSFWP